MRKHGVEELRARLAWALLCGQRVGVGVNALVDNPAWFELPDDGLLHRILASRGEGALSVHGLPPGVRLDKWLEGQSDGFRLSAFGGRTLGALRGCKAIELSDHLAALRRLDDRLRGDIGLVSRHRDFRAEFRERVAADIQRLLSADGAGSGLAELQGSDIGYIRELAPILAECTSRSGMYEALAKLPPPTARRIRDEIIDPAYAAGFVAPGEAFCQDRIGQLAKRFPAAVRADWVESLLVGREAYRVLDVLGGLTTLIFSGGLSGLLEIARRSHWDLLESLGEKAVQPFGNVRRGWEGARRFLHNSVAVEIKP